MQSERIKRKWSMQNLLREDDLVFWEPVDPGVIRIGDLVVLVDSHKRFCIHRAIGHGRTKGDWERQSDKRRLDEWQQCGRVKVIRRRGVEVWRAGRSPARDRMTAIFSRFGGWMARYFHFCFPSCLLFRLLWLRAYMTGVPR